MLVPLNGGAYSARSIIASAQRCLNLYPEKNPGDSPVPTTHYLTPGLTQLAQASGLVWRCLYEASNGQIYGVVDQEIFNPIFSGGLWSLGSPLGTLATNLSTPVSMQDNGVVILVVDGSSFGYAIEMSSNSFAQITDPVFSAASKVDYLDTFFILNVVGTNAWYISLSEVNFAMLTGVFGRILTGDITSAGNNSYIDGTYANQSLVGGTGSGATADIIISGGNIVEIILDSGGADYTVGDQLSAALPGTAINTWSATTGSGYTDGNYSSIVLTGGTGSGATADFTVVGGTITSINIDNPGFGFTAGDVLGATLPGGSGFTLTVVTTGGYGFIFTVDTAGGTAFDPLDFATKAGYPDPIVTLIVMHLEIWLIGTQTTEVWYNAGAADFTFQILPGVFIEHGCAAQYSVARQDLSIYWLSKDKQGQCIVLKGNNYAAHRISTYAIENEFSGYPTISDAVGFTYQQLGHTFYVLTFPTANKTWVWDESSELWHERASFNLSVQENLPIDPLLGRIRANCCCVAGNQVLVGDYSNGALWALDVNTAFEGNVNIPLPRVRSFPHLVNDQKRVTYQQFIVDMECGTDSTDSTSISTNPVVSLRWSDDRGKTYGNYVQQSLGDLGEYLTSIQYRRLGVARDRVFELSWSAGPITALNGAWIETEIAGT
jgi:hypothetical protein